MISHDNNNTTNSHNNNNNIVMDTDRRVGLLAVLNECLKSCARRGGSEDVIRRFVLAIRREVPNAMTKAISLEADNSEFRKCAYQALSTWKTFEFFPAQWLDKTLATLMNSSAVLNMLGNNNLLGTNNSSTANNSNVNTNVDGNAVNADGSLNKTDDNQKTGANNQNPANAASSTSSGIDPLAAESSGLDKVLKLFQKYNSDLERLRQFEANTQASSSAIESVRDDVVRRAQALLNAIGNSGGIGGFIPAIESEMRRIKEQQQNVAVSEDTADPLEDFF
jgi:hypothetical protein